MASNTTELQRHCAECGTAEDPSHPLKRCGRCLTTYYCNQDCQRAAWKQHKRECAMLGSGGYADTSLPTASHARARASRSPLQSNPYPSIPAAFKALDEGKWLDNRAETDVYKLLVDAYRLRVEDDYALGGGEIDEDSLYGGGDPKKGFRRFLRAAERAGKPLPSWWSPAKRTACEGWADRQTDSGAAGNWSDLGTAVEKDDIIEHYGHSMFPMQLRMLAEEILGSPVGGGHLGRGGTIRALMGGAFTGA